jgi:hypothetical protein
MDEGCESKRCARGSVLASTGEDTERVQSVFGHAPRGTSAAGAAGARVSREKTASPPIFRHSFLGSKTYQTGNVQSSQNREDCRKINKFLSIEIDGEILQNQPVVKAV